MIHNARIDLTVPYARKEEAKALGARWDPRQRIWYVPAGTDLTGFDAGWLPKEIVRASDVPGGEPDTEQKGVSLSELLATLKGVINRGMPESVWVRAEISEMSGKNGHLYLKLTDRSERGDPLGNAKGVVWKNRAAEIQSKFVEATGEGLRADIKILCLVQVRFDVLFGLDLIIEDVDPSYTLGDLAAKLARIRQRLVDERVFGRNRALPPPAEFLRVAVISPETSAGLGDFRRETDRLQRGGLCDFAFFRATFQGMDAPASIRTAVNEALASHRARAFDALAIIRGGGAVTDLAWLNDFELARVLCLAPVPILTGIGHERDNTILDEIAHRRFDTPSKVALHITSTIRDNATAALAALDRIRLQAARVLSRERAAVEAQAERIGAGVRSTVRQAEATRENSLVVIRTTTALRLKQERAAVEMQADRLRSGAATAVRQAAGDRDEYIASIKTSARYQLREADRALVAERTRLASVADQAVAEAASGLKGTIDGIAHRAQRRIDDRAAAVDRAADTLAFKADAALDTIRSEVDRAWTDVRQGGVECVDDAREKVVAHMRLIAGLGPDSTLRRGFAIAKGVDGRPITSRADAVRNDDFTVQFRDGTVRVANKDFEGAGGP